MNKKYIVRSTVRERNLSEEILSKGNTTKDVRSSG